MTIGRLGHGLVLAMTNCSSLTLSGKITWPAGTGQSWHKAENDAAPVLQLIARQAWSAGATARPRLYNSWRLVGDGLPGDASLRARERGDQPLATESCHAVSGRGRLSPDD